MEPKLKVIFDVSRMEQKTAAFKRRSQIFADTVALLGRAN